MGERNLTHVRDAVVSHFSTQSADTFQTVKEIAQSTGKEESSVGCTVYALTKRGVLQRRLKYDGSNSYEYAPGTRFLSAGKYEGRKFPSHGGHKHIAGKETVNGQRAVPALTGGVGIVIKIDGVAHAITMLDAKQIHSDLGVLFNKKH